MNHRSRTTTDLQSVPFGHSGTPPHIVFPLSVPLAGARLENIYNPGKIFANILIFKEHIKSGVYNFTRFPSSLAENYFLAVAGIVHEDNGIFFPCPRQDATI